ncbi:lipocalin family protein [Winogradskyella sp. Asnod2-B02-A]|uniref:lipocalin family protein n=1 Tax=Winogradskyella sp. Asnod2-B02-A TaxID=3160583 RepID=UPI00386489C7
MKNLLFIFSLTFFVLYSCSSEDENNSQTEENSLLLRKWYLVSIRPPGPTIQHTPCINGNRFYIEFSEPNIYERYYYDRNNNCEYFLVQSGTWLRDGDIITIDYDLTFDNDDDDDDDVFNIVVLNTTELTFLNDVGIFTYSSTE